MFTDTISSNDLLNHRDFSKTIASGIIHASLNDSNGFVLGLSGKWGSGKSTLLSFIREEIEKIFQNSNQINDAVFIDFNPWTFTDEGNIKQAFLKEFSSSLNERTKIKKAYGLAKRLGKVLERFGIKPKGGEVTKDILSLLDKYIDNDTSTHLKKSIDKSIVQSGKKNFVFIDDIDRLYPKQVFEILQVLKLAANFKNTYYIIAFDREAVEISIETQFKDYGKKYLDKIIQIDFLIPEAPAEKLEVIFFENLQLLLSTLKIEYNSSTFTSLWLHRGLKHYFKTLRDIYRFFNTLELTLPKIALDVDLHDFLILETLRLYDFDAYNLIHSEYGFRSSYFGPVDTMTSLTTLEKFKRIETKKLIQYLFPIDLENPLRPQSNIKRLHDPKHFDKYFTLSINSKDVSEIEFQRFITTPKARWNQLRNIQGYGRLKNLIYRLNDSSILNFYSDWDFSIITELYSFLEDCGEDVENVNVYTDAIVNLLTVKENERIKYFKTFIELIIAPVGAYSLSKTYFSHFMVLDKESDTGFSHNSYLFKEYYLSRHSDISESYKTYLGEWKNYIISKLIHNPLSYFTMLYIYDYARLFPLEYEAELNGILNDETNFIFFIKNIARINSIDNKAFGINEKYKNIYLPGNYYKQFIDRLRKSKGLELDKDQGQWKEFLLSYSED